MNAQNPSIVPNAKRLLIASFTAILAAGVGFGIRGGILLNWGTEFGFTATQLGAIGGAGFSGFCFGIIIGGVVADKIGYGKLVIAALLFHILSAFVTFGASAGQSQDTAYQFLFWGTFIFALANGTLEAVANPLIATLYPHNRTHYLNILHSSWPAGMVIGGAIGWVLGDQMNVSWKVQLGLFLIPTAVYGLMFLGQKMPKSEASEQGLGLGEMLKDVGIMGGLVACALLSLFFQGVLGPLFADPDTVKYVSYGIGAVLLIIVAILTKGALGHWLMFVLFVTHALIGAVELGTDGWIQNITGNILTSGQGKILFVCTSLAMFGLRFCSHFIEKKTKLSPVSLLLVCSLIACMGLNMVAGINAFGGALGALLVYALGKTFFWPTMLAVVSDRFPRSGAVAISIMGGIGMMSAGLLGGPGLGYAKDRFSGEALQASSPELFAANQAETASRFVGFREAHGIDAKKLGAVQEKLAAARSELEKSGNKDPLAALAQLTDDERKLHQASIAGDRKTLIADAYIPAVMAAIFLLLTLYFKSIGGYRPLKIGE